MHSLTISSGSRQNASPERLLENRAHILLEGGSTPRLRETSWWLEQNLTMLQGGPKRRYGRNHPRPGSLVS